MTDTGTVCARDGLREELQAAFNAFDILRGEIFAIVKEVKHGDSARAKRLAPAVAELGKTVMSILKECEKFDELRDRHGRLGPQRPIDLDAARSEIGRRLACLRGT